MKTELMDKLDNLEYVQEVADRERRDGNEFGWEVLNDQVNKGLEDLRISRAVARDFGWDL